MHNFGSISELTNHAAVVVDDDDFLSSLSVKGELSGVKIYNKRNASGQLFYTVYFKLKDASASVDGIMFLSNPEQLGFKLEDGIEVICYGSCSIYPKTGSFRLKTNMMRLNGVGDLQEQMRRLYEKLNARGLFAPEHKQKIPLLPKRIGIITSPVGDVIHDIIHTLNGRNTHYDILIYPARVSGDGCPEQIIEGLNWFCAQNNVDVIIIARGGGHPEEFVGFNTEILAEAIYNCSIPVISAVGHEPDYTICDYVADLRAPTPTGAGVVVMGGYSELKEQLDGKRQLLDVAFSSYIEHKRNQLNYLSQNKALYTPTYYVSNLRSKLQTLKSSLIVNGSSYVSSERNKISNMRNSLINSGNIRVEHEKMRLSSLMTGLDTLGPLNVLRRGYSYVTLNDKALTSVEDVETGSNINIVFSDGSCEATITNKFKGDK